MVVSSWLLYLLILIQDSYPVPIPPSYSPLTPTSPQPLFKHPSTSTHPPSSLLSHFWRLFYTSYSNSVYIFSKFSFYKSSSAVQFFYHFYAFFFIHFESEFPASLIFKDAYLSLTLEKSLHIASLLLSFWSGCHRYSPVHMFQLVRELWFRRRG